MRNQRQPSMTANMNPAMFACWPTGRLYLQKQGTTSVHSWTSHIKVGPILGQPPCDRSNLDLTVIGPIHMYLFNYIRLYNCAYCFFLFIGVYCFIVAEHGVNDVYLLRNESIWWLYSLTDIDNTRGWSGNNIILSINKPLEYQSPLLSFIKCFSSTIYIPLQRSQKSAKFLNDWPRFRQIWIKAQLL